MQATYFPAQHLVNDTTISIAVSELGCIKSYSPGHGIMSIMWQGHAKYTEQCTQRCEKNNYLKAKEFQQRQKIFPLDKRLPIRFMTFWNPGPNFICNHCIVGRIYFHCKCRECKMIPGEKMPLSRQSIKWGKSVGATHLWLWTFEKWVLSLQRIHYSRPAAAQATR